LKSLLAGVPPTVRLRGGGAVDSACVRSATSQFNVVRFLARRAKKRTTKEE
jgi:hypothetical protein